MTCIKTGCHIYIVPYGTFAYGDAHEVDGTFFFRLVRAVAEPTADVIHYEINGYDSWWGKDYHSPNPRISGPVSTLVVRGEDVISYGYEGRETRLFPYVKGTA